MKSDKFSRKKFNEERTVGKIGSEEYISSLFNPTYTTNNKVIGDATQETDGIPNSDYEAQGKNSYFCYMKNNFQIFFDHRLNYYKDFNIVKNNLHNFQKDLQKDLKCLKWNESDRLMEYHMVQENEENMWNKYHHCSESIADKSEYKALPSLKNTNVLDVTSYQKDMDNPYAISVEEGGMAIGSAYASDGASSALSDIVEAAEIIAV